MYKWDIVPAYVCWEKLCVLVEEWFLKPLFDYQVELVSCGYQSTSPWYLYQSYLCYKEVKLKSWGKDLFEWRHVSHYEMSIVKWWNCYQSAIVIVDEPIDPYEWFTWMKGIYVQVHVFDWGNLMKIDCVSILCLNVFPSNSPYMSKDCIDNICWMHWFLIYQHAMCERRLLFS